MKSLFLGALVCLFFGAGTLSILAQGPLTPPGAPTPTMKSLDQIEARRPISSVPFVINASGSYYLTKNLTSAGGSNAIIIQANNVTLDLNGFNLSSTENSGALGSYGIAINATSGVAILNGSITGSVTFSGGTFSGPGFGRAISCSAAAATNMRVVGVSVSGCYAGIDMGANSSVADSCTVDTVAARGITATAVTRCSSRNCGGEAIVGNNVSDSFGTSVGGSGYGIFAATVNNCYGSGAGTGDGIYATTTTNSWGIAVNGNGINSNDINNCNGATSSTNTARSGLTGLTVESSNGVNTGLGNGITATAVQNSRGYSNGGASSGGQGISANTVNGCYGSAAGTGTAISGTESVSNSSGVSVNGKGIETLVAINSSGTAGGNHTGLFCDVATNCSGRSPGNSDGIYAARAVTGCIGYSNTGTGIEVGGGSAVGCNGYSNSNTGLIADTAAFCTGFGGSGGIAIYATIATGCSSQGSSTITYKYNMP